MTFLKSFASDNNAPVHQAVINAITEANNGDAIGYGDDLYTLEAEQKFKEFFGPDSVAFFVFNGTGANVSAISHLSRSYHAIVCSDKAHLHHDECGAPEKFCGSKVLTLQAPNGKITTGQIEPLLHSVGFQHHAQPKIVSITQATELGTVYTLDEIMALGRFTDDHDMILHMDGARIANAAASLNVPLMEMVTNAGVDVLSFGGTKNGMMLGEAVVFLNPALAREFEYTRKQSMQLASKMRYISAQFSALLSNDLWLRNAQHANKMAEKLALGLKQIPEVTITQEVETNAVFAILPPEAIDRLLHKYFFYTWDETRHEVRWMTAFNTTAHDVEAFISAVKEAVKPYRLFRGRHQ